MSDQADLARRVADLEAREEIRRAIYYKARATDRADAEAERIALSADMNYTQSMGSAQSRAESIKTHVQESHHHIGNILIELDGDVARVETYVFAYIKTKPGRASISHFLGEEYLARPGVSTDTTHDLLTGMRYKDKFEKIDGTWRVTDRSLIYDWSVTQPSSSMTSGVLMNAIGLRAAWKPDDPSYEGIGIGAASIGPNGSRA